MPGAQQCPQCDQMKQHGGSDRSGVDGSRQAGRPGQGCGMRHRRYCAGEAGACSASSDTREKPAAAISPMTCITWP